MLLVMKILTLSGHVEGAAIRLDEPFKLPENARVLVTLLPAGEAEQSSSDWQAFSLAGLAGAYSDDEPDYSDRLIKQSPK